MEPHIDEYFLADQVSPSTMDQVWEQGWRHFGPYFFRYSYLHTQGQRFHVIPLRMGLAAFKPSTSQQRIMRRNQDLRIELKPAFVNDVVNELFGRHKTRFKRNVPPHIHTFVSEEPAVVPCPCLSLCLYEGVKLIGISYLDVGANSTSSVYQCFDPEYSKRSLGILMILHSIKWSIEQGKQYYYPGYAYKEPSEYDYKKRLGALESFDWQVGWRRYDPGP